MAVRCVGPQKMCVCTNFLACPAWPPPFARTLWHQTSSVWLERASWCLIASHWQVASHSWALTTWGEKSWGGEACIPLSEGEGFTWVTSSNVNGNHKPKASGPPRQSLKEQPPLSHLVWINLPPSRYILANKKKRHTTASGCFCQTVCLLGVESGRWL